MIDILIIFLAKYLIVFSVLIFLYCWYVVPEKKAFIKFALLCGAFALVLSVIASVLYYNPRPFMVTGVPPLVAHAPGNGFPSDHALLSGTLAAVVTVFSPYLGAVLWLVAILVGAGRVLAGVHSWLDVVTSFAIAIASAGVIHLALKRLR